MPRSFINDTFLFNFLTPFIITSITTVPTVLTLSAAQFLQWMQFSFSLFTDIKIFHIFHTFIHWHYSTLKATSIYTANSSENAYSSLHDQTLCWDNDHHKETAETWKRIWVQRCSGLCNWKKKCLFFCQALSLTAVRVWLLRD